MTKHIGGLNTYLKMKFPNFFGKKKEEMPKPEEVEEIKVAKPKPNYIKAFAKMMFGNEQSLNNQVDKEPSPFEKQLGHPDWVAPINRRPKVLPPKAFNPSEELKIRFARERNLLDKPLRPRKHGFTGKKLHKRREGFY